MGFRAELRGSLRSLAWKGASLGLEKVSRVVVVLVAAPVLGESAFGRFVFASTATGLLVFGTDLGLGVWTTRALARDRNPGAADRVVRVGLSLRALAAVPYALVVAALAAWVGAGERA